MFEKSPKNKLRIPAKKDVETMKRRWVFLLLVMFLLAGYGLGQTVQASDPVPGSEQDPLVTKSYIDNFINSHYADLQAELSILNQQVGQLEQRLSELKARIKPKIVLVVGNKTAHVGSRPSTLSVAPYIASGNTMLPFRFIGEALGAEVGWESDTKTVSYALGERVLKLGIGSTTATLNGNPVGLSAAPVIKDGSTMVPVRVVSEGLGAKVEWEPSSKTVTIIP